MTNCVCMYVRLRISLWLSLSLYHNERRAPFSLSPSIIFTNPLTIPQKCHGPIIGVNNPLPRSLSCQFNTLNLHLTWNSSNCDIISCDLFSLPRQSNTNSLTKVFSYFLETSIATLLLFVRSHTCLSNFSHSCRCWFS